MIDLSRYQMPANLDIPPEMFDFLKVLIPGAVKHGANNWLDKNGKKSSEADMHDSMFHHLAESFSHSKARRSIDYSVEEFVTLSDSLRCIQDDDSGLDPLLHLACRALMLYCRRQRGIIHVDDE